MSMEIKSTAGLEWMCKGVILTALSPAVDFGYKKSRAELLIKVIYLRYFIYSVHLYLLRKSTKEENKQ